MVQSCCAVNCAYRYKKGDKIGLHRFPREEVKKKLWVRAVSRKNWEPSKYSVLLINKYIQTSLV